MTNQSLPVAPDGKGSCSEWCCVSTVGTVGSLILLFCLSIFFAGLSYWFKRLDHQNELERIRIEKLNLQIETDNAMSSAACRGGGRELQHVRM